MSLVNGKIRCKKTGPLSVNILLDGTSTNESNASLTNAFIKFLCYQKGQIPVPFNQLEGHLNLVQKDLHESSQLPSDALLPLRMKERTVAQKQKRKKIQFTKNATSFTTALKEVNQAISNTFEAAGSQKVAVLLGTSIFNPKQIFILDWSNYPTTKKADSIISEASNLRKNQATLFRWVIHFCINNTSSIIEKYLVTSEELFPAMQPIRATKMHVLCQTEYLTHTPEGCLPRLNFSFSPSSYQRQVIFNILPTLQLHRSPSWNGEKDGGSSSETNHDGHRAVSRRLVFTSPAQSTSRPWKDDSDLDLSLDISGIGKLEEEIEKCNLSPVPEGPTGFCWFQVKTFLLGFQDSSL